VSLEYAIEYPCPVRWQINTDQIIAHTRLIALRHALRDTAFLTGETPARVLYTVATPASTESREYSVSELEGEIAEQNHRYRAICYTCPVTRQLQTGLFGCAGRINYPISALCEEQLAVVARRAWTEQTPAAMTIRAMLDARFQHTPSEHTWTGQLRRRPGGCERAEPVALLQLKRRERLTTDHLLSLLLSNGVMRDNRRRLAAVFLRELRPSFQIFLEKRTTMGAPIMIDRKRWRPFGNSGYRPLSVRTTEESFQQFIAFADAVLLAEELNCAIFLNG